MYLLFMDESGNPALKAKRVSTEACVIAGVAIPDGAWRPIDRQFTAIKARYEVTGELKWRDFASTSRGPLAHLDPAQRDGLRRDVYQLVTGRNAIRIIAVIGTPSVYAAAGWYRDAPDGFYRHALKALSERFQYFLQDMSRETAQTHTGLLVCDARERTNDQRLVEAMNELMKGGPFISNYDNIVEGLFMADSRLSTGIQLADMVAGAIWHNEVRKRSTWYDVIQPRIRRGSGGTVAGYGIVRI
jgi:hypothetical protein